MRLSKYIAHTGYCSRRMADTLIQSGQITINDKTTINFNTLVGSRDDVKVNGLEIALSEQKIWLYHKPARTITSRYDVCRRPTVFAQLPEELRHLISIGRLDFNTEGLLLMTNDGDISEFMTNPKNDIPRKYTIRAFGHVNRKKIKLLEQGIVIDNVSYKPIDIEIISATQNNTWFQIILTEGKNREIRNIFNFLKLKIHRLVRTEYGIFKLRNIQKNNIVEATVSEIKQIVKMKKCV